MNSAEQSKRTRFVVFCLEAYRRAEGFSGPEVADLFSRLGVTSYLCEGYDVLHTLGEAALLADIRDYVRRRTVTAAADPQS